MERKTMRFYKKPDPSVGDSRIITKFLLFPITIGLETRWLEKATYLEVSKRITQQDIFGCCIIDKWEKEKWL